MDKTYIIEVVELHEVRKTYYINAYTHPEAVAKAKAGAWDDASGDEDTGVINKRIVKTCKRYDS